MVHTEHIDEFTLVGRMLSPWLVVEICALLEYYAACSGNFYDVSG